MADNNTNQAEQTEQIDPELDVSVLKVAPNKEQVEKDQEVMPSNLLEPDNRFQKITSGLSAARVIKPTYDPLVLKRLTQRNNALLQAIEAYKVNIDGSGHGFRRTDGEPIDDADKESDQYKTAESFFKEPFLRQSMVSLRREIRDDLESTGNAYMEILRNTEGEFSMLKHAPSVNMRLLELDNPQPVELEIERNGKPDTVITLMRFRRFVQVMGTKFVYFKEHGAPFDLNKNTGEWAVPSGSDFDTEEADEATEEPIAEEDKATEMLWLKVGKDPDTPYGVPRWINQMPSVLGSRKAEEANLDFFNRGGIPPVAIFVGGGAVGEKNEKQIRAMLSGKGQNEQGIAVISVQSSSGSLDKVAAPQIKVERFGSEQQNDSLYENYDRKSEERVRAAFRLPQLFVGRTESMNFATAFASYVVAEDQVFQPNREEFDHIVNRVIMPMLGVTDYEFFSKPVSITSAEVKLKAASLVRDKSDGDSFMEQINDIAGTDFKLSEDDGLEFEEEEDEETDGQRPNEQQPGNDDDESARPGVTKSAHKKKKRKKKARVNVHKIRDYVEQWCKANGFEEGEDYDPAINEVVSAMNDEEYALFDTLLSARLVNPTHDPDGCEDLVHTATQIVH